VVNNSGRSVSTLVSLGDVDDQFVEITSGIAPSDWILTKNARYLRDDDKMHVTRIVAARD
jgi:hypothetical protein